MRRAPRPRPIVLLGEFTGRRVQRLEALRWGRMWISRQPTPYDGEPWGVDNGAFRDYLRGVPFDAVRFLAQIERATRVGIPFLAVAPDIVAGGAASLAFSVEWLPRLPADWPWYLAVQDGVTPADVAPVLGRFSGLFLGGTREFKTATARTWCDMAHAAGRRFHYARVGTLDRLLHACGVGADSLDSAFPMWTDARWRTFERWWRDGDPRLALALEEPSG